MITTNNTGTLLNTISSSSFNKTHAIIGLLFILTGICMYGLYKAKKSGKEEIMQGLFILLLVFITSAIILPARLISV